VSSGAGTAAPRRGWIRRTLPALLYAAFLIAVAECTLSMSVREVPLSVFESSHEYVPYVVHVTLPEGETTPFRATSGPQEGLPELWVFGGSTVWGGFSSEEVE
jgi:hypothetical protein